MDGDGENIYIEDESTLDHAIEEHISDISDEVSVTFAVKISLEYDQSRYSCAPPPASLEADSTEGHRVFFAGGEHFSAQQGGDAATTSSQVVLVNQACRQTDSWRYVLRTRRENQPRITSGYL